ncbi:F-box/LRR-repeat protein 6 [Pogona vitticeps]
MDEEPGGSGVFVASSPRKRKRESRGTAGPGSPLPKKQKKAHKPPRREAPHYFVHETDNDMLLIISNVGEIEDRPAQKGPKKRRKRKPPPREKVPKKKPATLRVGKPRKGAPSADQRVTSGVLDKGDRSLMLRTTAAPAGRSWGEKLPVEILVQIFQLVVASEGSVPFLCRVARVCRLWYGAASNPVLWQNVTVGCCWVTPGKKMPPAVEKRVLGTLEWLAGNRFSHLRDFALCHWKSHVPFVLKALADSCPLLASLKLSHCSGVTSESLGAVAGSCPQLQSLNLQNSQMDSSAVLRFLKAAGSRIRRLWLTYSNRMSAIIAELAGGGCPGLELLEVNTEIKQSSQPFQLPIEQLQAACPQLQVLRLLNVTCYVKPAAGSAPPPPGFPQLEELCLATTAFSFVDNNMLERILCASSRLRVLDLRGCFRVTPKGLELLPCSDLEQLYLGLYGSISHLRLPLEGSPLITWKWDHSLRELELAGQSFSEQDLDRAMAAFARQERAGGEPALHSLNLTGTKITLRTVSTLIASCPSLNYLNLSSCRHLPRGMKKVYRGSEEIRQCLHQLLTSVEESGGLGEIT